jgi:DNA-binding response OmpR family regulator
MSNSTAKALRPLEVKTLAVLTAKATQGVAMSREDWLNEVYQGQPEPSLKTLDVTIHGLRSKGYHITTLWGRGYELTV